MNDMMLATPAALNSKRMTFQPNELQSSAKKNHYDKQ
jgi:hypothetical protein